MKNCLYKPNQMAHPNFHQLPTYSKRLLDQLYLYKNAEQIKYLIICENNLFNEKIIQDYDNSLYF